MKDKHLSLLSNKISNHKKCALADSSSRPAFNCNRLLRNAFALALGLVILATGVVFASTYISYSSDSTYPASTTLNLQGMTTGQSLTVVTDNSNSIFVNDDTPGNLGTQYVKCSNSSPATSGGRIASGNPDYQFELYYNNTLINCVNTIFFTSSGSGARTITLTPMILKLVKVGSTGSTASITYPTFQLCVSGNTSACFTGTPTGQLVRYTPTSSSAIVVVNSTPVINSNGGGATASVSAAENQTAVTTVTATDGDGDTLTYSITGGADSAKFSINATTGVLTFVTAPDFENPTDVGSNNVYDVQVTVSDGNGGTDVQAIAITVTDVAEDTPNLLISKSGPATAPQGTYFAYTLVVTNTGVAATSGTVTMTDILPAGLSFVSGSGGGFICAASGQTVTCTSSTVMAINGTATINLIVNPTAASSMANTASVIGGGDTSAATSNTVNTMVTLGSSCTLATTRIGYWGQYPIATTSMAAQVTNLANYGPSGTYHLSQGITFEDVTANLSSMNAAQLRTRYAVINMSTNDPTAAQAQKIYDYVSLGGVLIHSYDIGLGSVLIQKFGGTGSVGTINAPTTFETTSDAVNNGIFGDVRNVTGLPNTYPSGIIYSSQLPVGARIIANSAAYSSVAGFIMGPSGTLQGRAIFYFDELQYLATSGGVISSNLDKYLNNILAYALNESATCTANLLIGKSGPATATQGTNFAYTLVVTNTSTVATSGVVTVTDTLPAGLSFVSGSGGGFSCSAAGQVVTCTSSTAIAVNGTATITLAVNPSRTGNVSNSASVVGGGDTTPATSTTVNTTVNAVPIAPDLTISLGQPAPALTAGLTSTLPVTVANIGNGPTTGVITVTVPLPANVSAPASFTNNGWTCTTAGQTVNCTHPGPINAGENRGFGVPVIPAVAAIGTTPTFNASVSTGLELITNNNDAAPVTASLAVVGGTVLLPIKVFLGGAYNVGTGLMNDTLRTKSLIPTTEPYTGLNGFTHMNGGGSEQVNASVFSVADNNAIVDWVFVELRDSTTPATVIATRAALVQRDGDVVGLDGVTSLVLPASFYNQSYAIAVRHRNHLGVMTASPVTLTPTTALIDFTLPATAVYGTNAEKTVGSVRVLWSGNANANKDVIYTGPNNDINTILFIVLSAPGNAGLNRNYVVNGYNQGDIDLDGKTIAAGPSNDVNPILGNVYIHPGNVAVAANYIIVEQLP